VLASSTCPRAGEEEAIHSDVEDAVGWFDQ